MNFFLRISVSLMVSVLINPLNAGDFLATSDKSSEDKGEFITISKWNDLGPFKGKIVAFVTNDSHFSPDYGLNIIEKESKVRYGFIDEGEHEWISSDYRGPGESMAILLNRREFARGHKLTNNILEKANLIVRLANKDELEIIEEKINKKTVYFEYMDDWKMIDKLKKQIGENN